MYTSQYQNVYCVYNTDNINEVYEKLHFIFYIVETQIKTNISRLIFIACKIIGSNILFLVESAESTQSFKILSKRTTGNFLLHSSDNCINIYFEQTCQ